MANLKIQLLMLFSKRFLITWKRLSDKVWSIICFFFVIDILVTLATVFLECNVFRFEWVEVPWWSVEGINDWVWLLQHLKVTICFKSHLGFVLTIKEILLLIFFMLFSWFRQAILIASASSSGRVDHKMVVLISKCFPRILWINNVLLFNIFYHLCYFKSMIQS